MSLDHLEAFFSQENNKPMENIKEAQTDQDKPILTASIKIDSKNRELYLKMANSINKSERLRGELTKGIKDHKPVDDLLLIALECISLMIDDKTFYNQNIENLKGRP